MKIIKISNKISMNTQLTIEDLGSDVFSLVMKNLEYKDIMNLYECFTIRGLVENKFFWETYLSEGSKLNISLFNKFSASELIYLSIYILNEDYEKLHELGDCVKEIMNELYFLNKADDVLIPEIWTRGFFSRVDCIKYGGLNLLKCAMENIKGINLHPLLFHTIRFGQCDIVYYLIEQGAKPTCHTMNTAIKYGYYDLVYHFMECGLKPSNDHEIENLNTAIKAKFPELVHYFVDNYLIPDGTNVNMALNTEQYKLAQYLAEKSNILFTSNITRAINYGQYKLARYIIDEDTKLSYRNIDAAITARQPDLVHYLVNKGAVPNRFSINKAIKTNQLDIMIYLIDYGIIPYYGNITTAANCERYDIVYYLIDYVDLTHDMSACILNPLMGYKKFNMIRYFVRLGVKPSNCCMTKNITLSIMYKKYDIIPYLVEHGAFPNSADITKLLDAGKSDMVRDLVEKYDLRLNGSQRIIINE